MPNKDNNSNNTQLKGIEPHFLSMNRRTCGLPLSQILYTPEDEKKFGEENQNNQLDASLGSK